VLRLPELAHDDIPFAHARLSLGEYARFMTAHEGLRQASRRLRRLRSLNPPAISDWRAKIEALRVDVLGWEEHRSRFAEAVLAEHPDVTQTVRHSVDTRDLVHDRLRIWPRRRES
jgi:hypothetical protein